MDASPDTPYEPLLAYEEEVPLARPLKRWAARALDTVLFFVALMPGILLMLSGEDSPLFALGLLVLFAGGLGFVAYQALLLGREGQTVAKRALRLRVVDYRDGSNPGFARAVLVREVLTAALGVVPLFSLADALFIFGAERRCIHDHFATTRVVDETHVVVLSDAALL